MAHNIAAVTGRSFIVHSLQNSFTLWCWCKNVVHVIKTTLCCFSCLLWPWPLTFWLQYLISISMNAHTLWPELGKIAFIDMWDMVSSTCHDLDLWTFDVIVMSQARVYTWPSFGEISSNVYQDSVFTWFFRSLTAVTLTFNVLTPKSNQHIFFNSVGGIRM